MLIEVLLQSFIGKVNTKLLETVFFEDFKTKYVQNIDRWHAFIYLLIFFQRNVNFADDPVEGLLVNQFANSTSVLDCLQK
jgi:hypothetical protein